LGNINHPQNIYLAWRHGVYEYATDEFTPDDGASYNQASLPAAGTVTYFDAGYKNYELSNHLGNVLATFTDRKVPSINAATGSYNFFNAQVTTVTDYYPFGMQIEERSWTAPSNKYRFGFNGQEKDDEVKGSGNSIAYEARILDTRLGRWMSVDMEAERGLEFTPYNFGLNNPLYYSDPDGNWVEVTTTKYYRAKDGSLKVKKWWNIFKRTVFKETQIKIHNLKVYYHSGSLLVKEPRGESDPDCPDCLSWKNRPPTQDELNQAIKNIANGIIKNYSNAYEVDEETGRSVSLKVQIVGEIELVTSLDDVNTKAPDELIVLVGDPSDYTNTLAAGLSDLSFPNITLISTASAVDDKSGEIYSHEFAHQRYGLTGLNDIFDVNSHHYDGGIFNPNGGPNFLNLWNMTSTKNSSDLNLSKFLQQVKQEAEKSKSQDEQKK
ncbi:MAG: RHS repeat domain-containing protein, partial [Bacteroidota bacterium]